MKYCSYCCNTDDGNDLRYMYVGKVSDGFSLNIRSGSNQPTALLVFSFNNAIQEMVTEGIYIMKYCPECGRRLFENDKFLNKQRSKD